MYVQVEDYQNTLKLSCWPPAFTSIEAFLKSTKSSGTSLPVSFSERRTKKNIFHFIFYQMPKFHYLIVITFWDIGGNMSIVIICCLVCDVIVFEINQNFFMKLSFFIS